MIINETTSDADPEEDRDKVGEKPLDTVDATKAAAAALVCEMEADDLAEDGRDVPKESVRNNGVEEVKDDVTAAVLDSEANKAAEALENILN